MREAMDETVRRGVPEQCARDFLLGHMNILAAVIFKEIPGAFSDACNKCRSTNILPICTYKLSIPNLPLGQAWRGFQQD